MPGAPNDDLLEEVLQTSPVPARKQALKAILKKPPAKTGKQKPKPKKPTDASKEKHMGSYNGVALKLMAYKQTGGVGVRVKNGKQLFQVGKYDTLEKNSKAAGKIMDMLEKGATLKKVLEAKDKMV